ncbi:MAG TPA: tetratricopeptide repeat protein [Rudaea sp.]|nr:tetratricopeptide repeat protein [Rudaea sp.]
MSVLSELRRRNVIRMAGLYLVGSWLIVQVSSTLLPLFDAPQWLTRSVVILLAIGFVPALIFSWMFELTPEGLKRDAQAGSVQTAVSQTARRMDQMIFAALALALVYFAFDKFVLAPRREAALVARTAAPPSKPPAATNQAKSIAVLPFQNMSADPDNAYFASGMQEMILTKLANIGELKVISRTSTEKYKSRPADLKMIAQQLGVATVLDGSVQKAGNSVLISVQLIDAGSDAHLWAEAYTRTLDNIFDVEGDVAQRVADALKAQLSVTEQRALSTPPTRNAEAYNLYLQAGYYLRQSEGGNADPAIVVPKALELYTQATVKDAKFAQAFAQMAYARAVLYWDRIEVGQADIDEALRLADHALALNPGSAEAHIAKGYVVYWGSRDYAQALREFAEAQRLEPNVASIALASAFIYRRQGNWQASLDENARAAALDPLDPQARSGMAYTLALVRRYAEAQDAMDRTLAISPEFWDAVSGTALIAVFWKGDTAMAQKAISRITDSGGPRGSVTFVRFEVAMWSHDFDAALAALAGTPERIHTNPGHVLLATDLLRAQALEAAGRNAPALAAYEKAIRALERDLKLQPAEPSLHAFLGRAYAGVGRKEDAMREGRRAVELLPVKDDAFGGPFYLAELAKTYARLGNADEAIPLIRELLAMPAGLTVSVPALKIDPAWDPIRHEPRFEVLLVE